MPPFPMIQAVWKEGDSVASTYLPFEIDGVAYAAPIEYVFSIVSTLEEFPSCVPPKRPAYVERVIRLEQGLVTVIEWSRFGMGTQRRSDIPPRMMLIIFRYGERLLGVLADHVTSPFELLEPKLERDAINEHTLLLCENAQYILFDVPGIYSVKCDE